MTVGMALPRIDAIAKVTGQALYPGDLVMPGMVHAKLLFARRPHARVLSLDATEALAVPGVVAVFTGADVPVNEYGLAHYDAPVLVTPLDRLAHVPHALPFDGIVRHVGERVALIVAESEELAARARDLIRVTYSDLQVVDSMFEALQEGAPQVHPQYAGNILQHYRIRKGNVEAGFAQADEIVEGTYYTHSQEHAYLQPEAGLAYLDEAGRVTVQVAGQWAHKDQEQVAHALDVPKEQVRIIYPAIGGAFGGREDMSVQIVLALAAFRLHRPVKMVWTREESIIGHHKRHPMSVHARLGAKRTGQLLAAQIDITADAGPYAYTSTKVLGNSTVMCVGPYEVPHVAVDARAVMTNNLPTGAFRGFGAPQALFVAETQINKLAERLGMDPVELRLTNVLHDGSLTVNNTPVPSGCSIADVVTKCASASGWGMEKRATSEVHDMIPNRNTALSTKQGRGFACGHKNVGFSFGAPERCEAKVELHGGTAIEYAVVYHAGADCGQGAHTVFAQVAAEALGLPVEKIRLVVSDTARSGDSGSASASRMTFMASHSIRGAALAALRTWQMEARPAIATYVYRPRSTTAMDPRTGEADPNITYGYVAQSVEVEVDTETGLVTVRKLVCVDDVGHAVNPQQVIGQIEGGAVQALGWVTLENFVQRHGIVLTPNLSTYLMPTVLDTPDELQSVLVENPDPNGEMGVRGMAEMPFLVVAPAIVAAIHDATGVWVNELPITPERLLQALAA